ncbi:hypothetical protein PCH70_01940 [Pseudomonas cichorii JBC1]|nr:hypothetical protein PCH70_01940 [Pseudomonas cichorii JBC1]
MGASMMIFLYQMGGSVARSIYSHFQGTGDAQLLSVGACTSAL